METATLFSPSAITRCYLRKRGVTGVDLLLQSDAGWEEKQRTEQNRGSRGLFRSGWGRGNNLLPSNSSRAFYSVIS